MQVRIEVERNPNWVPDVPMEYARCARRHKFGADTHSPIFYSHEQHAVCKRELVEAYHPTMNKSVIPNMTGGAIVVATDIKRDLEYVCPVTVGTEPVILKLNFDTGSSDLWVWSTEGPSLDPTNPNRKGYNHTKSNTSKLAEGLSWHIRYGDDSEAKGVVCTDDIAIGQLVIKDQAVEVATELSYSLIADTNCDGLLGLGFWTINTVVNGGNENDKRPQKTPVQNMIEQGLLEQHVFTARLVSGDGNTKGFYTFGYIDTTIVNVNDIKYAPVNPSHGFWEFPSTKITIGEDTFDLPGNKAIADTGTTLIYMSAEAVDAIYSSIDGAVLEGVAYSFPQTSIASLPDVGIAVGEHIVTIPGRLLARSDAGNGNWYGTIQSRGKSTFDILGDVFLQQIYAVFDQSDKPRFGFVQLK